MSHVIKLSYSISLLRRCYLWASVESFWSSSPRKACPSLQHAHWWVPSAQTSLKLQVTLVADTPALRAHGFFCPPILPLLELSSRVAIAKEGHFQSFHFQQSKSYFPNKWSWNHGWGRVSVMVCWPWATSLSVCDINLCIGSAGVYEMNYCPNCWFLKLEILC